MSGPEISTLIHFIVAFFLAGTLFFQWRAVHPAVVSSSDADGVRDGIRSRWGLFVRIGIVLLLVTGIYQLMVIGMPKADLQKALAEGTAGMPYHMLFGIKFLLALWVFFISSAMVGRSSLLEGIRQNGSRWLGVTTVLVVVLLAISRHLAQMPSP